MATVINDTEHVEVEAELGARWLMQPRDFAALTGWTMKPEGMCRADVCARVYRPDKVFSSGGLIDLQRAAPVIGLSAVVDPDRAVGALGASAPARALDMMSLRAPGFTLPNLRDEPVSLGDFDGRKVLLLAWSSWCACRYELPVWQDLHQEFLPHGLSIIAVAIDSDLGAVRQWASSAPDLNVLIDREYTVAERYGIVNVPATVWIDESGKIVRPAGTAPGDDRFRAFAKVDSSIHHTLLRKWVMRDEHDLDDTAVASLMERPTAELQLARLHRRVAVLLHDRGDVTRARTHLSAAGSLAPNDWVIRRGSMPMNDIDPFGREYFSFVEEWTAAGSPGYRLAAGRQPSPS